MKKMLLCLIFLLGPINGNVAELSKFRWEEILYTPPISEGEQGFQVLHFNSKNKPYILDKTAVNFVQKHFRKANALDSEASVIRYGSDAVTLK